jgi:ribosomal protein S18 acetylase RimI-like enzyme
MPVLSIESRPPGPGYRALQHSVSSKLVCASGATASVSGRQERQTCLRLQATDTHAAARPSPWRWLQRTFRKRENIYYVCDRLKGPSMESLAELWASCFDNLELLTAQGVADVTTAIDHSFTVTYAFVECTDDDALSSDDAAEPRLIGAARTLSDGQFAAQVLDVCVHEDYRRQGIGSKLVKQICEHTKGSGPQSLAVFAGSVRTTIACSATAQHSNPLLHSNTAAQQHSSPLLHC